MHRLFCSTVLMLSAATAWAAEPPKDSPLGQAGATAPAGVKMENIQFAGVSTVGSRTMINLYDKQQKRSFWLELGKSDGDLAVTKYDSAHDQITVRQRGTEKVLPLRPPSAVVNGSSSTPAAAGLAAGSSGSTGAPTPPPAPVSLPTTQARQEEEARMLVSDLLEIGMAQRKAYEEAQKRAAGGQAATPAPEANAASGATAPGSSPTGGAPLANPNAQTGTASAATASGTVSTGTGS
jgi:hypothetical protein